MECICDFANGDSEELRELAFDEEANLHPPPDCPCFMFRSKRSNLVKKLWKLRIQNETQCSNEILSHGQLTSKNLLNEQDLQDEKAVTQAMLKRLKENDLESLLQAVEGRGVEMTECVMLPRDSIRLGRRGQVAPHVLCCQIWRWPDLKGEQSLKKLSYCTSSDTSTTVCCNPYHWSLLLPGMVETLHKRFIFNTTFTMYSST